jgi:acyl carrier protein
MDDQTGLQLFDRALQLNAVNPMTARLDLAALRTTTQELPAVLADLVSCNRRPRDVVAGRGLAEQLRGMDQAEQRRLVFDTVIAQVALVLGYGSTDSVDTNRSFKDLGFDSLSAVEIRTRLSAVTGLKLSATLVFDYPTPTTLTEQLLAQLSESAPSDDSVLAEIAMLELMVRDWPDDRPRSGVADGLRRLLETFENRRDHVDDDPADDLSAASAEQLFDILDRARD